MTRGEVRELHYITHVDNVASILQHGILPNHEVARRGIKHVSVAMAEIQARRRKQVPGGRLLHDYANLYFNARNPMMYRKVRVDGVSPSALVVLRVSARTLDIPEAVVADKNASSDYVKFMPPATGLAALDAALIFTDSWNCDDAIEKMRRKSAVCAEVLIPDGVPATLVVGAYVSGPEAAEVLRGSLGGRAGLDISINPHIFFL
jgi:hypothetical protein